MICRCAARFSNQICQRLWRFDGLRNRPFMFRHRFVSSKPNFSYGRYEKSRDKFGQLFYLAAFWAPLKYMFGLSSEPLDDDEVKAAIKEAVLAVYEKKYDEAFDLLHKALQLAHDKKNESGENYVIDMLANLYYQKGDFLAAEKNFTELMRRLIGKGTSQTDPAIIEISLKLADIYARNGDFEKADLGFQFCINSAREHADAAQKRYDRSITKIRAKELEDEVGLTKQSYNDPYALYGIVLETYAQYLVGRGRAEESVDYINKALELSHAIFGPVNVQTVTVLNNYAIVCLQHGANELAENYLKQVLTKANLIPELADQLPGFYCNYAEALWHSDQRDKAVDFAKRAVELAKEVKDEKMAEHAKRFLLHLEKEFKKKRKK